MHSTEFAKELQKIDPQFTVVENPNRPGLSNIFYAGKNYDLPVIATADVRAEVEPAYQYEFPNGMRARHWTQSEIIGRCEAFLKNVAGLTELYKD